MIFDQAEFEVRCEWGLRGLKELAPVSDIVVIVDVLSFSTALDVATARGGIVFPHFRNDLSEALRQSSSGKELIQRGFAVDVDLAAELNVSSNVPRLVNHAFVGGSVNES